MSINVGEVISVNGVKITIRVFEESNKETLFFRGEKYKGISIREYVLIQRGFIDIVCLIEGEFLDENKTEIEGNKSFYIRKVEARPIGFFQENEFKEGIKFMPMIKDPVSLLSEDRVSKIYSNESSQDFVIGKLLKEELPISLHWEKLFNTHIGIFGNTGSGKSNTLAKLYTVLFNEMAAKIRGKSTFILLDFNGEYTGDQLIGSTDKKVYSLNTQSKKQEDENKFPLSTSGFWNSETLSILFQASQGTQKPFLIRLIDGREKYIGVKDSLQNYTKSVFEKVFKMAAPKPELLDILRRISKRVGSPELVKTLGEISWHSGQKRFVGKGFNEFFNADGKLYKSSLESIVQKVTVNLDDFDELVLRALVQLTYELIQGFVQFDHIQPLLKRMESFVPSFKKVLKIKSEKEANEILTVISFRKCNQDIKKILPLLIAKHYYSGHTSTVETPPNKTLHLIIDEAHNILSEQSSRESEGWKDYRLELFEEIIKEGRKYGMFITISSQRPADISPTIVSQIHNFFIHRLVNDKDLFLLDNTISTLDRVSKNMIPNLPRGGCIVTGVSFILPMLVQVDILEKKKQPDSEDVNLELLWA